MSDETYFEPLLAFLEKLPAVVLPGGRRSLGHGRTEDGLWWVKFRIDTHHALAWRHVQELGHVLNSLSATERLPTVFMPVSPPPYLNGGEEYISWVIESTDAEMSPEVCAGWLEGRLPTPVDELEAWSLKLDDDDA